MSHISVWIKAFRLRTLPLAFSSIFLGAFLAAKSGLFAWPIFGFSILTTLFLQILSNLANDYGDTVSGVDGLERVGPGRTVQEGLITKKQMKNAVIICGFFAFVSGVLLIYISFNNQWGLFLLFLALGMGAIIAAIKYTVGKNPYGYAGFGDLFVLLFFGIVGVSGSYFLYHKSLEITVLLPSLSCGLFAVGVININNIRDIESDAINGKKSIPVRIGRKNAVIYHIFIIIFAIAFAVIYGILYFQSLFSWLFIITVPLLVKNIFAVGNKTGMELDVYLRQLALTTLLFVILFGLGLHYPWFE